jgi:hypothetical protein
VAFLTLASALNAMVPRPWFLGMVTRIFMTEELRTVFTFLQGSKQNKKNM